MKEWRISQFKDNDISIAVPDYDSVSGVYKESSVHEGFR